MNGRGKSLTGSSFDFGPFADLYESWYATPEGRAHDEVQRRDVRGLLESVPGSGKLLEVGCGTGHWSRFFRDLGYEVQGIDVSEDMIRVAREASPECSFELADARRLPYPDSSFDVVASITALEFIPDPAAAVGEMARCAKAGGGILIGTLNRLAPINRDRLRKNEEPYASGHLLAPDDLVDLLSPLGEIRIAASPLGALQGHPRVLGPGDRSLFLEVLVGPLLVAAVGLPQGDGV